MLVTAYRVNATTPSPHDEVPKISIHLLETAQDCRNRVRLMRLDNNERRYDVEKARKWIYELGLRINGSNIEALLKEKSFTPTRVSPI